MSEFVTWYDSSETGAPVLNNAAGSLIAVLDACLVTGFNSKSVTTIAVASNVATVTCTGHGYSPIYGKDIVISGATPSELNGRKAIVTVVTANTFTFAAPGVSDQTATGTITVKRDPLGWVKQFSGTNKAIYKRSDVTATSIMLRVLDTAATAPATVYEARAFMVESATDIDTYLGQQPTQVQLANGNFWNKGPNDAAAKQWMLIGDSKTFYLFTQVGTSQHPTVSAVSAISAFGDFQSFKSGDSYNCFLNGAPSTNTGAPLSGYGIGTFSGFGTPQNHLFAARSYSQLGDAVMLGLVGIGSSSPAFPLYPSPIDGGFLVLPVCPLCENNAVNAHPARGIAPGVCQLLANQPLSHQYIIDPVVSLPGRRVMVAMVNNAMTSRMAQGFDLTGPWQ